MFHSVRMVMSFVENPQEAAQWWSAILGASIHIERTGDATYAWLEVDGVEMGFHPADDAHNPRGASPVVYWAVDDLRAARQRLLAAGCVHHRGPLQVSPGRQICQLTDPFGTVIGLEGP